MGYWPPYVPVAKRREKALKEIAKLKKKGRVFFPVVMEGRKITCNFWGNKWCEHVNSFADYENRLARGATYLRNGSVHHLEITPGSVVAVISGTRLYQADITVKPLPATQWAALKKACVGKVGSLLELLQGKLSHEVMLQVCHPLNGIFPSPKEMKTDCSCPDWAGLCKHLAAVMYGIGHRFDTEPELLFTLRRVNPAELLSGVEEHLVQKRLKKTPGSLVANNLGSVFGIEIDEIEEIGLKKSVPRPKKIPAKPAARSTPKTPAKITARSTPKTKTVSEKKVKLSTPPKPKSSPKKIKSKKN